MNCPWVRCLALAIAISASAHTSVIGPTERELECYSQEKVYHEETGKCYKLLTKGPCESGEWLVLDRPRKGELSPVIRPVCHKEKCGEGEYYWASERKCVEAKEKGRLCGESADEELLNNVFGEGECSCAREPPRARVRGDKKNRCYQLYTRGPCRVGQIVVLSQDEMTKATCSDDPCHVESIKRKKIGSLSKDAILAQHENGTCYELGTQGPCPDDLVFKVHTTDKRPDCVSLLNNIFGGVKQCPVDENGDCQKEIAKKKGNKYLKELQQYLKKK